MNKSCCIVTSLSADGIFLALLFEAPEDLPEGDCGVLLGPLSPIIIKEMHVCLVSL